MALPFASGLAIAELRSLIGALILMAFVAKGPFPNRRTWRWIVIIGLFNTAILSVGIAIATARVGAAGAAVLTSTSPLLVAAFGAFFLHEGLGVTKMIALPLGLVGVVFTVLDGLGVSGYGSYWIIGVLFGLSASGAFAVATLVTRSMQQRSPSIDLVQVTAWQLVIGAVILLPVSLPSLRAARLDSGVFWLCIMYLSVATLSNWCWFRALRDVKASYASSFLFLVPVVSTGVEILRFNIPSPVAFFGMALTIAAVFFATRS